MTNSIDYQTEKKSLVDFVDRTKRIIKINEYLKQFNWAFVHPYLIGFEINEFEELEKNNSGNKTIIFEIFSNAFFDLRTTSVFIEGYFKKRESLAPFCQLIDQSVFLCLQRDYAGGINILIPVIEGSIRHYLVNKKGKTNEKIMKTEDLIKVFDHLREEYLNYQKDYYKNRQGYNQQQIKQLLIHQSEFIDTWFSIIKDYFKNNLYLDTRNGDIADKLNRHSIFHGFSTEVYYNLENYLKLFNFLNFLSFAFGLADPNIGPLADIESKDIVYKWKAFEKIHTISRITTDIKSSVYKKYSDFDEEEFTRGLRYNLVELKIYQNSINNIEQALLAIDKVIDGNLTSSINLPKKKRQWWQKLLGINKL
jgi:hypothetical protein